MNRLSASQAARQNKMLASASLSIGQCATLACLLEATAPKAGNVHRGADFEDLTFHDFVVSAVAIGPIVEEAQQLGVGTTVLQAVTATRAVVRTNSNLGIVLLLAPLAAVPRSEPLTPATVGRVLGQLTADDSGYVYQAIRQAQPGGLGKVDSMDVTGDPPRCLLAAMQAAADRDLIARQYVENFQVVLEVAVPLLLGGRRQGWSLTDAVICTHLELLSRYEDSLIARKCGPDLARKVSALAGQVLAAGRPGDEDYYAALSDFDFWLRADGHRRNPGTTADLIAAALFAGLRDGLLAPPWR
jgi:triphosphoribosyl-dephospho-CoA synthase